MIQSQITGTLSIGDRCPLTMIGGPCVIESEDFTLKMAEAIHKVCDRLEISFIFTFFELFGLSFFGHTCFQHLRKAFIKANQSEKQKFISVKFIT